VVPRVVQAVLVRDGVVLVVDLRGRGAAGGGRVELAGWAREGMGEMGEKWRGRGGWNASWFEEGRQHRKGEAGR